MKMRSWNYITLDQISTKVTSFGGKGVAAINRRPKNRFSNLTRALVVSTALLTSANAATRIQPIVGTNPVANIPVEAVESSSKTEPRFLEHFSKLFDRDFIEAHGVILERIAATGASLDATIDGENVAIALRGSDRRAGWKEMA